MSNNNALVSTDFGPSCKLICLLNSLNLISLEANMRSLPSTEAAARINSKLLPVSTWLSTLTKAS